MIFIHNVSGVANSIMLWVFGILMFGVSWVIVSPQFALYFILPLWLIVGIPYSICMGRTIVLNSKGCTIYFLGYKKTYLWEQLKCKRVEDCTNYHTRDIVRYKKMVSLAPYRMRKTAVYQPSMWTIMFHPFSSVYIYFKIPKNSGGEKDLWEKVRMYEVEETLFWEKMKEWGVEFEIE